MRGRINIISGLALTLLVLGALLWANGARARSWADGTPFDMAHGTVLLPPLVIDDEAHHLGDQAIGFFDVPEPEGLVYSITFTLSISAVQDSFLRIQTYNVELDNPVQLNGVEVGPLPGTWWVGWQPVVLPLPAATLQEGENTLVISSAQFSQWRLFEHWRDDVMFRRIELLASQTPFQDEFDASLHSRWDWVDLLGDCAYSLAEKPGSLTIHAPSSTTAWWDQGHDLFWLTNFDAPRLLQPIQGDFVIETRLSAASHPQANYQAAGLLAWQDTWHYVRLERNAWWGGSVYGGLHSSAGTPWTFRLVQASDLDLRLSRVGDTFAAWYRQAGAPTWSVLGQATATFSETLLVGLAVYNQGSGQPALAEFDYFYISQLAPPIFNTPCGTTNQVQPLVRGLATSGAQVRLYADGSQAAMTTATVEGAFAVSPTVALSPGSHALTATVTNGSEESPPSSDLSLTVEPGASVDLLNVTITHAPLFGDDPPLTDFLRNRDGCAACDGSGFNVWIPGRKPITVSLPISGTDVISAQVRIGDVGYALDDPDGDSVYQGTFTPPDVRGVASLKFVVYRADGLIIEYACGEIIIDPYGVVYDAAIGPSAPISGAVVTLYQQDPATWEWNAWLPIDDQENPQATGSDGRYAFDVPEGTYYITVEAAGYMPYASQPILVSVATGPVELLVPLNQDRVIMEVYLPLIAR